MHAAAIGKGVRGASYLVRLRNGRGGGVRYLRAYSSPPRPMHAARLRVVPAPPMPMPSEAEAGVAWIRYVPLRIIEGEADTLPPPRPFLKGGLLPPNPLDLSRFDKEIFRGVYFFPKRNIKR